MALEKVKIYAYGDNNYSDYLGIFYQVPLNPEKMSLSRNLQFNNDDSSMGKREMTQFQGYGSDSLSFDIVIDGTGITGDDIDVTEELKNLQEVLYDYNDEKHMPNHLLVTWGEDNKFLCQLKTINIEYSLFKTNGDPLRAKVSLQFVENSNPELINNVHQPASPDMTHIKVVSEGDNLLQMCQDVYGDKKYYIAVARINGLTNFRDIKVGSQLLLPPLEKTRRR